MNKLGSILVTVCCLTLVPTWVRASCTNAVLKGACAFQETHGTHPSAQLTFSAVGVLTFDGKNSAKMDVTISYSDGSLSHQVGIPITYNVASDCRLNFAYQANGETFEGVVVQNGGRIFYIETTGDPFRDGEAQKLIEQ